MNVLKLKGTTEDYKKLKSILTSFGLSFFQVTPDAPVYAEDIGIGVMKHLLEGYNLKFKQIKAKSITISYTEEDGLVIFDYDERFNGLRKSPAKTLGDLIRNKDYDYIEVRDIVSKDGNRLVNSSSEMEFSETIVLGICASKGGELRMLSSENNAGQIFKELCNTSFDTTIVRYQEWTDYSSGIENGLTIVRDAQVLKKEDKEPQSFSLEDPQNETPIEPEKEEDL